MTGPTSNPAENGGVVIAGGGQAGFQVAASLRQGGYEGPVTIVSEEQRLPYQRPPLSKTYIKTDAAFDSLLLKPGSFFDKNAIAFRSGLTVEAIDRAAGRVTLSTGEHLAYDHLVVAVGAANRALPIEGRDLSGVHQLRTAEDAEQLRADLGTVRRVVIIGGGFIGLEVAAALRAIDKEVTVLEAADRLMGRTVSREVSRFFLDEHRRMGTEIRLRTAAASIRGHGRVGAVALPDGSEIAADLVLIAAGVLPNDRLARDAGLATDNGILVDHHMTTDDPRIFAIGDCAAFHSPFSERIVRLESVQNAVDQAKLVAQRIIAGEAGGEIAPYRAVPWFWSDQGPFKLQIVGLTAGADHVEMASLGEAGRLVAYCFRGDRLLGIETVNRPGEHMLGRRILAEDLVIARSEVSAEGFDLKAHVAALKAGS
ncbi:pyridine nucleotide-disulfide oxidoreductase [Jiella endophytica]|uniref:Pyridine nucleotide-disulfide oxidoreductase n=1 Tax=Jiella endophytica TaxID=2558362 RepID=A0A4Y8RPL0_9HYPH|nr:FAD-dependent oxidoreductase [Jiella endophytica]TFF25582.1 pyridine nucleotide-disulfide oxidoreductase [Jiella endophytica]